MSAKLTLFLCELLPSVIVVPYGIFLLKRPPKVNSMLLGYGTRRSTASETAWYTAQHIFGKYCSITFSVTFALSFVSGLFALIKDLGKSAELTLFFVLCAVHVIAAIAVAIATEWRLYRLFNKDGTPRDVSE